MVWRRYAGDWSAPIAPNRPRFTPQSCEGGERGRVSEEEKRNGERHGAHTPARLALARLAMTRCLHRWARIRQPQKATMIKNSWVRVPNPQHRYLLPQPIRTTNHYHRRG